MSSATLRLAYNADSSVHADVDYLLDTPARLAKAFQLADIEGIAAVRYLIREARHDKAFIVLATHDISRDRRIIQLMEQFEDLDYDLVPQSSSGMIPDAARQL